MATFEASSFTLLANQSMHSSVTNIIKEHLIRRFPKDFFKYVYMRNSNASITEQYLNFEDRLVKPKPSLAIGLSFDGQDNSFNGDPYHFGITNIRQKAFEQGFLYDGVLKDYEKDFYISAFRTRTKLIYEIGIKLESEMKAVNVESYIRGYMGIGKPFYINNAFIEIPIPNNLINTIALQNSYDIHTPAGIAAFNDYLKDKSKNSIVYKTHLVNGRMHYFYKYTTNILCKIQDKISFNKNNRDKSITDCILSFGFEIELSSYLNFIYERVISDLTPPPVLPSITNEELEVVFNYSIQLVIPREHQGLTLLSTIAVLTSNADEDSTIVKNSISRDINDFKDYCMVNNILDDNLKLLVFRESTLIPNTDYTVDWNLFNVNLLYPFKNYQYTFAFFYNEVNYTKFIADREKQRSNIPPSIDIIS